MSSSFWNTTTTNGRAVMCKNTREECDSVHNKLQEIQMELFRTKKEVEYLRGLDKSSEKENIYTLSGDSVPDYMQFWFQTFGDVQSIHSSRTTRSRRPRPTPYDSDDVYDMDPLTPQLWVRNGR